jgi:predicted membrane-bound mannosyltransferase
MFRWLILALALVTNIAFVLVALSPSVVTYADVVPSELTCPSCTSEALAAVVQAKTAGRRQIQNLVGSNVWLLIGLALTNFGLILMLVWSSKSVPKSQEISDSRV